LNIRTSEVFETSEVFFLVNDEKRKLKAPASEMVSSASGLGIWSFGFVWDFGFRALPAASPH
jgi:hypothetical protein